MKRAGIMCVLPMMAYFMSTENHSWLQTPALHQLKVAKDLFPFQNILLDTKYKDVSLMILNYKGLENSIQIILLSLSQWNSI